MKSVLIMSLTAAEKLFQTARLKNFSLFAFYFSLLICCLCLNASAQQEEPPEGSAPPPLSIMSKQEKSSLDAETDISERTKLSLILMEARLKNAEDFSAKSSFAEMSDELGCFNALMQNTLSFLNRNDTGRGKVLNNFKRLEISLRGFAPRIELIRRDLPLKYEFYVRMLLKKVREARSKAIEPMFSDSVVPVDAKGN